MAPDLVLVLSTHSFKLQEVAPWIYILGITCHLTIRLDIEKHLCGLFSDIK